ncbi:hypothetical protein ABZO31_29595 [Streptomyces sp. HUAS MG47]|uniref:hypothetical protein n=1 Tax=Streptomyces solicamelliae TaxID=3231716 RepID=UPI00387792DE
MNRVREGLARNPSLPGALVDRLIAAAVRESDERLARELADRDDLSREQVRARRTPTRRWLGPLPRTRG